MPLRLAVALPAIAGTTASTVAQDRSITGTNRVIARHADRSVVIADTNRGKLCYAGGSPRSRRPEGAVRGRAFLVVTTLPSDQVRDEFAVEFGFEVASASTLTIGDEAFALAGDMQGAWIANLADETGPVAAARDHAHMTLRSVSRLGAETVDTYALGRFNEALRPGAAGVRRSQLDQQKRQMRGNPAWSAAFVL